MRMRSRIRFGRINFFLFVLSMASIDAMVPLLAVEGHGQAPPEFSEIDVD